ncbi:hypothetical protein B566_EDAN006301 [Ephemera danica]|nr:hypothetical protein B566_EDAN006301 [Ephemera danica]
MRMKMQNMFLSVIASTILVSYLAWTSFSKAEEPPLISMSPREFSFVCQISFEDTRQKFKEESPVIYFITPTYPRREQFAELTRLGQTLMHVSNLHWIVADDRKECNVQLNSLLQKFGIPYTYLVSPMPNVYRKKHFVPRGVSNRRAALSWIKSNIKTGVLYFGDDDNTFDLRLFDEIRSTKKVSMFPVGLIGGFGISSPVLKEGKIIGFFDSWPAERSFPVDMAGFAVSVDFFLQHPNATMPYKAGHEEDRFLKSLDLKLEDIEPKANMCTEVS